MNIEYTRMQLWVELISLRIDIELLKIAGDDSATLRSREIRALQVANQLKAECARTLQ